VASPDIPKQPEFVSVVVICGVAGSGRGTALKCLEDMGYNCVDNLPPELLTDYAEHIVAELKNKDQSSDDKKYGLLLGFNSAEDLSKLEQSLGIFEDNQISILLIYLDAQNYVLERRFKETRRPHVLQLRSGSEIGLEEALEKERGLLSEHVNNYFCCGKSRTVQVVACGFKFGSPRNADLVIDVRFLPNPHFVPGLRQKTGQEEVVQNYVYSNGDAEEFLELYSSMVKFLLPRYELEGKRYLTLAIGCTGGKHRSVTLSEKIAPLIKKMGFEVELRHRDLSKNN